VSKTLMREVSVYSRRLTSVYKALHEHKEVLYSAGKELAKEDFADTSTEDLKSALEKVAEAYRDNALGNLKIYSANANFLVVRIYDGATCAEVKRDGKTYCWFDAGYIAGALETILKKDFVVLETKCRGTGYDYCEFIISPSLSENRTLTPLPLLPMDKMPL